MPGTYTLTEGEKKKFVDFLTTQGRTLSVDEEPFISIDEMLEWCVNDFFQKIKKFNVEFPFSREYVEEALVLSELNAVQGVIDEVELNIDLTVNTKENLIKAITEFPQLSIVSFQALITSYEQLCEKFGILPSELPSLKLEESLHNILNLIKNLEK